MYTHRKLYILVYTNSNKSDFRFRDRIFNFLSMVTLAIPYLCNEPHTGQQSFYAMAVPKVGELNVKTKYSECNSFYITNTLLNSENLKVAIVQLCNELQVCNFTML